MKIVSNFLIYKKIKMLIISSVRTIPSHPIKVPWFCLRGTACSAAGVWDRWLHPGTPFLRPFSSAQTLPSSTHTTVPPGSFLVEKGNPFVSGVVLVFSPLTLMAHWSRPSLFPRCIFWSILWRPICTSWLTGFSARWSSFQFLLRCSTGPVWSCCRFTRRCSRKIWGFGLVWVPRLPRT